MTNGTAPQDTIKRSVTKDDHGVVGPGGSIINFMLPSYSPNAGVGDLLPYWSRGRDYVLAASVHREAMWGAAVNIAITKKASQQWEITSDIALQKKNAQHLLQTVDGGTGWTAFIAKHLRNFLTTDNGSFVEVVRATSSVSSKIIGLMHLDSHRCTRTGDPDIPVIYRDKKGRLHEMQQHEVIMLADMPDPAELYLGVGLCAASRAYPAILKLEALETYVREKLSGSRALALYFVNGVQEAQLRSAIATADAEQTRRGAVLYKGAVVIPNMGDQAPTVAKIDLSGLPDGFEADKERSEASLIYADAIGLDWQDLRPLTGGSLGTGAQSQVLDDKEQGKGLAAWDEQFTFVLNQWLLSDKTTFAFSENDYRDKLQQANVSATRGATIDNHVLQGVLTAKQAVKVLVEQGELPDEFLNQPTPDQIAQAQAAVAPPIDDTEDSQHVPAYSDQNEPGTTSIKAASDVQMLIASQLEAARKLALALA